MLLREEEVCVWGEYMVLIDQKSVVQTFVHHSRFHSIFSKSTEFLFSADILSNQLLHNFGLKYTAYLSIRNISHFRQKNIVTNHTRVQLEHDEG